MLLLADSCPFCGDQGQLGFVMCDDGKTVLVACDECDAIWSDARARVPSAAMILDAPHLDVPGAERPLRWSRWANRSEVERAGLADLIAGEYKAPGEPGYDVISRRRWNSSEHGPLTEASVRSIFTPDSFRIGIRRYEAGTTFPGWARAGTHIILQGQGRFHDLSVAAGDVFETRSGKYTVEVVGDEDLVIVSVWERG